MVKTVEEYPYSSAHHFLDKESTNKCLQNAWITKSYQGDMEAIKAFLDSSVDTAQLQELKKASNLVEASNSDKKPDIKKLGVLGVSQVAIYGVIKRSRK